MDAFLGVKGSPVKSGRPDEFFEHLYPEMGTKPAMIIPTGPGPDEKSIQADRHAILMTTLPRWPRSRRGGPAR